MTGDSVAPPRDPSAEDLLSAAVRAIGGVERPGQVAMAQAADRAWREARHLLVQAGTGTGKSLAYLVAALLEAGRTDQPVVVATATLALQAQLVDRDLPALAAAVEPLLGRRPTFATLKGRSNYACLHRVRVGVPDDSGVLVTTSELGPLGRDVRRARDWADEQADAGGTGERERLQPGVADRAWAQVSVSARECIGAAKCPYGRECFAERARDRAANVDIVVTNHALLAIDAAESIPVLPEHDAVVVDEAHELVARVTGVATQELAPSAVERAARRLGNRVAAAEAAALTEAADLLRDALADPLPGRLAPAPEAVRAAVAAVRDAARAVLSALAGGSAKDRAARSADAEAAHRQAKAGVDELFGTAERVLAAAGAPADGAGPDVLWLEQTDRFGRLLKIAPLSVADLLAAGLFARRTAVLTSATLRLGGSFDAVASGVGLPPAPGAVDEGSAPAWVGLDVGSPFDYPRQGILYVARHLPPPGRDGPSAAMLDELTALVLAAGGRTLGLFSSRRAAEAAADHVRTQLAELAAGPGGGATPAARGRETGPLPAGSTLADHAVDDGSRDVWVGRDVRDEIVVLCQGDDLVPTLVRQFAAEPRSCLFGTLSLWQGVDVPGSACQLVVLDRLPFPRPDDPLVTARSRAVDAAGGNGFLAVSVAHAALLLAQGSGRLIRRSTDRGVVAVLDPRLVTARYGGYLRASLPPLWPTTDRAVVLGALARLDRQAEPAPA